MCSVISEMLLLNMNNFEFKHEFLLYYHNFYLTCAPKLGVQQQKLFESIFHRNLFDKL